MRFTKFYAAALASSAALITLTISRPGTAEDAAKAEYVGDQEVPEVPHPAPAQVLAEDQDGQVDEDADADDGSRGQSALRQEEGRKPRSGEGLHHRREVPRLPHDGLRGSRRLPEGPQEGRRGGQGGQADGIGLLRSVPRPRKPLREAQERRGREETRTRSSRSRRWRSSGSSSPTPRCAPSATTTRRRPSQPNRSSSRTPRRRSTTTP